MKPRRKFWFGPLWFFLIWATIWGAPRLRSLTIYQISSDDDVAQAAIWIAPLAAPFTRLWPRSENQTSRASFAARYSDDAKVQAWLLSDGLGNMISAEDWAPLVQKFPDKPWLYASYIIALSRDFKTGRVPGTLGAAVSGVAPPTEKAANLSPVKLREAIALCRRGAQLEPKNCFWDWMEALFLFGTRSDGEALQLLQKASYKPIYNDHVLENVRLWLEVEDRRRSLMLEEKFDPARAVVLPHLTRLREVTRLTVWKAMQKQARGDWKGALHIRADMARLAGRVRDQDANFLISTVGLAMQNDAWRFAGMPDSAIGTSHFLEERRHKTMLFFSIQCRLRGRADLAAETLREGERSRQILQLIRSSAPYTFFNVNQHDQKYMKIGALNWLGASMLIQLLLALPAWLFLSALLWGRRVPGAEANMKAVLAVWGSVLLCCVLALACFGAYAVNWQAPLATSVTAPDEWIAALRFSLALAPVLLGALFCGLRGAWKHRTQWRASDEILQNAGSMRPALRRGVWLILSILILVSIALYLGQAYLPFWLKLVLTTATSAASTGLLERVIAFFVSPLFALNLMFFALAWWIFSSVWLVPEKMRFWAGENLKWYRQSLGMALVGGSALYLLLLLISLQVRRPAEEAFNNLIQRGEMAVLRGTMHKKEPGA